MARGTTLGEMVRMLRLEIRRSSNLAINQDDVEHLRQVLARTYEQLYDEHDWPQLRRVFPQITLQQDERFYDFPTGLNPERVERVAIWYGGVPHEIERGISIREYASFDSADNAEPALRWDFRWDGDNATGTTQFEIWPTPSSNGTTIEFTGIQSVQRLTTDSQQCLLDDNMIVLFAAAQLLKGQDSKDADRVAEMASARFEQMKKRISSAGTRRIRLGLGERDDHPRDRAIIRISG